MCNYSKILPRQSIATSIASGYDMTSSLTPSALWRTRVAWFVVQLVCRFYSEKKRRRKVKFEDFWWLSVDKLPSKMSHRQLEVPSSLL